MAQNEQVKTGSPPGFDIDTAGSLIARGEALQQVQTPYMTAIAVQNKRDLKEITRRCIEEAELAGDSFFYHWEVESTNQKTGKKTKSIVENGSINCALAAIRNFGNAAIVQRPVQETETGWIFTAAAVDLETGYTLERPFRMDKNFPVYGKMDRYRKDDIRFQIGASKSIRNAVFNFVPRGLIDKMVDAAKGSVRKKIEKKIEKAAGDINTVIQDMLNAFGRFHATQEMIEKKIGLPADKWDVEILTLLSGDLRALKDGIETADSLYGEDRPEPQKATLSPDDMKAGDPSTHQGYEKQEKPQQPPDAPPKDEKPAAPANEEREKPKPERSERDQAEVDLLSLLSDNEEILGEDIMAMYPPEKIRNKSLDELQKDLKLVRSMVKAIRQSKGQEEQEQLDLDGKKEKKNTGRDGNSNNGSTPKKADF